MSNAEPLVQLESDGRAAVLNYNVPQPSSYTGRNLIELAYDPKIFRDLRGEQPDLEPEHVSEEAINDFLVGRALAERTAATRHASDIATRFSVAQPVARASSTAGSRTVAAANPVKVDVDVTKKALEKGYYPVVVGTQSGNSKVEYAPIPTEPKPGIYLVETYRLSNFLGDYGAGKTIQTFSLLPGEKTRISITTYKTETTTSSKASSIFDSYTEETADEFEESVQSENSSTEAKENTLAWSVEAEASGNWGVASASVSTGVSGSTNSSREEFASNVSNAASKHASSASASREVSVNTSTETTTETGEETAIEREIENINASRTLNFVFRQMNQEFISILHLLDVRVAFWNGFPDTRKEVPLHELGELLEYCIARPKDRKRVEQDVLFAIQSIRDWKAEAHYDLANPDGEANFIRRKSYTERDGAESVFFAVNRDKTSSYSPSDITVDGLILAVKKQVLRTDGVIVEAVLGQGDALDAYSHALQDQKVAEKQHDNRALELDNETTELALQIVRDRDAAAAEVYERVFGEAATETIIEGP